MDGGAGTGLPCLPFGDERGGWRGKKVAQERKTANRDGKKGTEDRQSGRLAKRVREDKEEGRVGGNKA
jgi:hypothetical protein